MMTDLLEYLNSIPYYGNEFIKEMTGNGFLISHHALDRYKERVSNINNSRAKKDILLFIKRSRYLGTIDGVVYRSYKFMIFPFKRVKTPSGIYKMCLVTVMTIDEEIGNTYFTFLMKKRRKLINKYFQAISYKLQNKKVGEKYDNKINECKEDEIQSSDATFRGSISEQYESSDNICRSNESI